MSCDYYSFQKNNKGMFQLWENIMFGKGKNAIKSATDESMNYMSYVPAFKTHILNNVVPMSINM